ncbi:methyl-accepting chemotaxis protein [uncultured Brachyspira sp.]|uniref:methyl-accepting chemotaxis protein n=1 Tax=uncultured Brachyspira sp. TaxID=221953 RepID=UPI0025852A10|nr:methyl-accepting chemotaxis protein [uncultured Brachyspira sp.]
MDNNTNLKYPNSSSWREAYEIQSLIKYEAPNTEAVYFLYDNVNISGGQSLDNSNYPNFGYWSNNAINESVNKIKVSGFLREEEYLNKKIDLINAFKIKTDDENPAFIFLPLYPRLKVTLISWSIDENANENGQCKIELNFNICSEETSENIYNSIDIEDAKKNIQEIANNNLEKKLEKNFSYDTFLSSINNISSKLSNIIGMIQGKADYINDMARAINTISSAVAQGVRTPSVFANALQNAISSIVNGVIEIKQSANETIESSKSLINSMLPRENAENNEKKVLLQFLNFYNYDTTGNTISFNEMNTAKESDNFMKIIAVTAVASLIIQMDNSKEKIKNYLELYDKLNNSINKDDYGLNNALIDLKISIIEELKIKELKKLRKIKFNKNMTLLNAQHFLNSYNLRDFNFIEDSFVLPKEVFYV